jgi:hypothetical protein
MRQLIKEAIIEIISEGREEFLKNKNQHISERRFNILLSVDPTPNKKYLQWLINQYNRTLGASKEGTEKTSYFLSKTSQIKKALTVFDRATSRSIDLRAIKNFSNDINKYDADSLIAMTRKLVMNADLRGERERAEDIEKVYSDDKVSILIPKTRDAAIKLGRGTGWCTSYDDKYNQYLNHAVLGDLYVIIDKQTNEKYQYHIATKGSASQKFQLGAENYLQKGQFKDAMDVSVNISDFNRKYPNVMQIIQSHIENNLQKFQKKYEKNLKSRKKKVDKFINTYRTPTYRLTVRPIESYSEIENLKQNMGRKEGALLDLTAQAYEFHKPFVLVMDGNEMYLCNKDYYISIRRPTDLKSIHNNPLFKEVEDYIENLRKK